MNIRKYQDLLTDASIALGAFLASRAALMLVGWIAITFIIQKGDSATVDQLANLACRWDCGWYVSIAEHGYSTVSPAIQPGATNLAFWPAFPFATRLLSDMSGMSIILSGITLSNIAFAVCLFLFKRYCTAAGLSHSLATFTTFLMAFSPQSFVFSSFYGDAFGLLGVVGSMYFARSQRWWLSGVFAVLATSSRPTGVVLMVFLMVHAYTLVGWRGYVRPWMDPRPFIPVVLLPAGELLVFLISYNVSGDAFAQTHSRIAGWHATFELPWLAIIANLRQGPAFAFWTICALILFGSIIPLLRSRLFPEAIYTFFSYVLILSGTEANGLLRYAVAIPTTFIGLTLLMKHNQPLRHALLAIFASLGAVMFCAWAASSWISI